MPIHSTAGGGFLYPSRIREALQPWRNILLDSFEDVVYTLEDRDQAVEDYLNSLPQIRVHLTVDQAIPSAAFASATNALLWDDPPIYQSPGTWEAATPARLYAPKTGVYVASGTALWENSAAAGFRGLVVMQNGANGADDRWGSQIWQVPGQPFCNVCAVGRLKAGEFVEFWAFQTTGGDLDVITDPVFTSTASLTCLGPWYNSTLA